ncbi:hypothetical protein MUP65_01200, partial [Patescibacteria group bacterium]|nr:hypothetical protein [Patescibacteria group bacterium]
MSKNLNIGVVLKGVAVVGVLGALTWSGWEAYRAYQKATLLNQELVGSYRVIFQPDRVKEAAELLRERKEKMAAFPEKTESESDEVEPEQ